MLAAASSQPVKEALLQEQKDPAVAEVTPNSIEELAVMLESAAKILPPDETDLREQISQRLATGGFRPGSAPPASAPAFAAPVARHAQPVGMGRMPRQRRERVRLGSECPTELESAFEKALNSALRWLTHAPQPTQAESDRLRNRRRSAEDRSMLNSSAAASEVVLKRCPTWPRIG